MTYQVFVQQLAEEEYRAVPLVFPDIVAAGKTRDEALTNLRSVLDARLAQGEIVSIEVGAPEHPWLKGAGLFKNDPTYNDFMNEVEAYRREIDTAESGGANVSPWH
jgi:predicted RNase H-like HicB family nuclease